MGNFPVRAADGSLRRRTNEEIQRFESALSSCGNTADPVTLTTEVPPTTDSVPLATDSVLLEEVAEDDAAIDGDSKTIQINSGNSARTTESSSSGTQSRSRSSSSGAAADPQHNSAIPHSVTTGSPVGLFELVDPPGNTSVASIGARIPALDGIFREGEVSGEGDENLTADEGRENPYNLAEQEEQEWEENDDYWGDENELFEDAWDDDDDDWELDSGSEVGLNLPAAGGVNVNLGRFFGSRLPTLRNTGQLKSERRSEKQGRTTREKLMRMALERWTEFECQNVYFLVSELERFQSVSQYYARDLSDDDSTTEVISEKAVRKANELLGLDPETEEHLAMIKAFWKDRHSPSASAKSASAKNSCDTTSFNENPSSSPSQPSGVNGQNTDGSQEAPTFGSLPTVSAQGEAAVAAVSSQAEVAARDSQASSVVPGFGSATANEDDEDASSEAAYRNPMYRSNIGNPSSSVEVPVNDIFSEVCGTSIWPQNLSEECRHLLHSSDHYEAALRKCPNYVADSGGLTFVVRNAELPNGGIDGLVPPRGGLSPAWVQEQYEKSQSPVPGQSPAKDSAKETSSASKEPKVADGQAQTGFVDKKSDKETEESDKKRAAMECDPKIDFFQKKVDSLSGIPYLEYTFSSLGCIEANVIKDCLIVAETTAETKSHESAAVGKAELTASAESSATPTASSTAPGESSTMSTQPTFATEATGGSSSSSSECKKSGLKSGPKSAEYWLRPGRQWRGKICIPGDPRKGGADYYFETHEPTWEEPPNHVLQERSTIPGVYAMHADDYDSQFVRVSIHPAKSDLKTTNNVSSSANDSVSCPHNGGSSPSNATICFPESEEKNWAVDKPLYTNWLSAAKENLRNFDNYSPSSASSSGKKRRKLTERANDTSPKKQCMKPGGCYSNRNCNYPAAKKNGDCPAKVVLRWHDLETYCTGELDLTTGRIEGNVAQLVDSEEGHWHNIAPEVPNSFWLEPVPSNYTKRLARIKKRKLLIDLAALLCSKFREGGGDTRLEEDARARVPWSELFHISLYEMKRLQCDFREITAGVRNRTFKTRAEKAEFLESLNGEGKVSTVREVAHQRWSEFRGRVQQTYSKNLRFQMASLNGQDYSRALRDDTHQIHVEDLRTRRLFDQVDAHLRSIQTRITLEEIDEMRKKEKSKFSDDILKSECTICMEELCSVPCGNVDTDDPFSMAAKREQLTRQSKKESDSTDKCDGDDADDKWEAIQFRCGHLFHSNCATKWLETQSTCPTCRQPVVEKEEK